MGSELLVVRCFVTSLPKELAEVFWDHCRLNQDVHYCLGKEPLLLELDGLIKPEGNSSFLNDVEQGFCLGVLLLHRRRPLLGSHYDLQCT